ncbi:glycosyl transferase family 2 [Pseudomonas caspiana]|uniref:Glycosyl transferase family 2 n=2 Tax=Pseudomonas caspiana TaxID=1451454 RepID=A0A1Y3P2D0_9PSED|nr:glycosyl transferase family 2 [Pseudomonas caspiana]
MCTYNGQLFLEKQLESISSQTCNDWHVAISDDGSEDETLTIAWRYRLKWGEEKLSVWQGPGEGFARNFMSLVCHTELSADHYAWCDQDDMWDERKLQVALSWLQSVPKDVPALYFGRTQLVDSSGVALGYSPLFRRSPSFANALVQNIGGGNTMVLNHAARVLLQAAGNNLNVVSHDWWAYLLVTGAGGNVFYDPSPYVMYRQHAGNLVGANSNWRARVNRMKMMSQGRFQVWNSINIANLEKMSAFLTHENRELLERFKSLRTETLGRRLAGLKQSGIYRQTRLGNLSLIVAATVGKI